jgi:hypothetical protein
MPKSKYQRYQNLIDLKKDAKLTYFDIAIRAGDLSPSAWAQKCTGFMAMTDAEKTKFADICADAIGRKAGKK